MHSKEEVKQKIDEALGGKIDHLTRAQRRDLERRLTMKPNRNRKY